MSRFLDLHAAGRRGVATVYLRDLDSSSDRTYGLGAALRGLPVGERFTVSVEGDVWDEPKAVEALDEGSGWHAAAELEAQLGERFEAALKVGAKSAGWLPGLRLDEGAYVGFGLQRSW